MLDGVGDSSGAALRQAHDGAAVDARTVNDRLQVFDLRLEREIGGIAVGETHAAPVVTDEGVVLGENLVEGSEVGCLPLVFKVSEPAEGADERRSAAGDGLGDADAVGGLAEADVLFHRG